MAGTLEIVVTLLIFVLVLTAYFTVVAQSFAPLERDPSLRSQSVLLSTLLISEPGHLANGTADGTRSWEDYPASGKYSVTGVPNIRENLTGLGLGLVGGGYGVVDRDKVEAMRKVRYDHARDLLGLSDLGLHVRLKVETADGETLLDYGPKALHGEVHSFKRVISLRQVNTTVVPVDFPVEDKLVINEMMWHPVEAAGGVGANEDEYEWIELWNPNTGAINVSGWHITNDNPKGTDNQDPSADNELKAWESGGTLTIPPGGYAIVVGTGSSVFDHFVVDDDTVRLKMDFNAVTKGGLRPDGNNPPANPQGEKITLVDDQNSVVEFVDYRHTWGGSNYEQAGDNFSLARIDPYGDANDESNWRSSQSSIGGGRGGGGTPGITNDVQRLRHNRTQAFLTVQVFRTPATFEDIVINEVMYHPDGDEDDLEYVELYNPTDAAIDLNGWTISDGSDTDTLQGLDTLESGAQEGILPGKGHAVVVANGKRSHVDSHFDVHDDAVWVEVDDDHIGDNTEGLSNSGESLTIEDAGGHGSESITYSSDTAADGTGESLERVDPLAGWSGSNVQVSDANDGLKGTPGRVNSVTAS